MSESKPIVAHAKALIACAILIVCGMGISAVSPFISISCTRSGNEVASVIEKRVFGLIRFNTTQVEGLLKVGASLEAGSHELVGTTDTYYFLFDDSKGNVTKVMASSFREFAGPVNSVVDDINTFLDDESQTRFNTWFRPLLGWAGLLPAALGGVLFLCVAWNMFSRPIRKD